jgi:beta-glucanase (GH16 family)
MLGNNVGSIGWPACGEIDIMEMIGGSGRENRTNGTIHWEKDGVHVQNGGYSTLSSGTLADEYHVFTIVWDKSAIKWLINDREYYSVSITPDNMSEFHQKFFFIMNLAVGGNWPGNPDSSTVFPQSMKVDYLRVFQKQN